MSGAATEKSLYLFCGDDEYQVSDAVRKRVNALCPPEEQTLGLEIIDGAVNNAAEAIEAVNKCLDALRTLGFFGGRKVTWLRDVNFLGETQTGKAKDVKEQVAVFTTELKKGLQPDQILVISAGKVDRRSALFKTCQASGEVASFVMPAQSYKAEEQAKGVCASAFRDAGLQVSSGVLEAFLSRTGVDTRQIVQEIEKLSVYLADRKAVTLEDIELMVSASRENMAWDLADAVALGNLTKSLTVLRQLLFQKESEVRLIIGLESRVKELLIFRTCIDRGWVRLQGEARWTKLHWGNDKAMDGVLGQIGNDPRSMNPYRAGRLAHQASLHSMKRLLRWQAEVGRTHQAMVSSGLPGGLQLETLILRLLGSVRRTAGAR